MDYKTVARDRFASLFRALAPPVAEPPSDLLRAVGALAGSFLHRMAVAHRRWGGRNVFTANIRE